MVLAVGGAAVGLTQMMTDHPWGLAVVAGVVAFTAGVSLLSRGGEQGV